MNFNPLANKPVRQKQEKCEIVVEKTSKGIRKRINGNCTREQIKLLSESNGGDLDLN